MEKEERYVFRTVGKEKRPNERLEKERKRREWAGVAVSIRLRRVWRATTTHVKAKPLLSSRCCSLIILNAQGTNRGMTRSGHLRGYLWAYSQFGWLTNTTRLVLSTRLRGFSPIPQLQPNNSKGGHGRKPPVHSRMLFFHRPQLLEVSDPKLISHAYLSLFSFSNILKCSAICTYDLQGSSRMIHPIPQRLYRWLRPRGT